MANSTPAGYYHAAGDPPNTMRYWDGTMWVGEPTVMASAAERHGELSFDRFVLLRDRVIAALFDGLIGLVVLLPVLLATDGLDPDKAGEQTSAFLFASLGLAAVSFVALALYGGSPGKLIAGQRVTKADGYTTPIGWGLALKRSLPNLVSSIPVIGILLALGILIASVSMIQNDPERRSVFDRVGNTRVVYKDKIA